MLPVHLVEDSNRQNNWMPASNEGPPATIPNVAIAIVVDTDARTLGGIRIADTYVSTNDKPPATLELQGLLVLRAGEVIGDHTITARLRGPEGGLNAEHQSDWTIHFRGEDHKIEIPLTFHFAPGAFGLFWIDAYFESTRLTSIPFRLIRSSKPAIV